MKKLLLLLVLTCYVSTASATSYTVYFRPNTSGTTEQNWRQWNERYALYMFTKSGNTTTAEGWTDFSQIGTTGVYSATIDASTYTTGMIICRMNGSNTTNNWDNKWFQSGDLSVPSSDIYYDKSSNLSKDYWIASTENMSVTTPSSYSTSSPVCVVAGDSWVVNNNENWQASSTANKMTYNNDFTYSLSVTEHYAHIGKWGCKIIKGGEWCGDPENSGNNFPVNINPAGKYTLTYTYNIVTGRVTVTPTLTTEATVEYKVEKYSSDYEDVGTMTVNNGLATLTTSPVSLTAEDNNLQWKIYWTATINDTQVADGWSYYGSGVDGRYAFTPIHTGNHTVTYFYNPYTTSCWAKAHYITDAYYYIGGSGGWTSDKSNPLASDGNGNYSITINNKGGHTFAIAPSYAYTDNAVSNWGYIIHPDIDENNVEVEFVNKSGLTKEADCSNNWEVPSTYADYITLTFTPATNTWTVEPYRTATIGKALYATWSNGEKYTVSGAEKIYTVGANKTNSVTLTEQPASTVFPANEGILVKGKENDVVKFYAVASTTAASTIGTNYLVGSGNNTQNITASEYTYVFSWDGSDPSSVGFYLASGNGTLAAHKAYLDLSEAPGKAGEFLSFNFDEEETDGISKVANANFDANAQVYNLAGQKVGANYKGIVIVNGKKVVRK